MHTHVQTTHVPLTHKHTCPLTLTLSRPHTPLAEYTLRTLVSCAFGPPYPSARNVAATTSREQATTAGKRTPHCCPNCVYTPHCCPSYVNTPHVVVLVVLTSHVVVLVVLTLLGLESSVINTPLGSAHYRVIAKPSTPIA